MKPRLSPESHSPHSAANSPRGNSRTSRPVFTFSIAALGNYLVPLDGEPVWSLDLVVGELEPVEFSLSGAELDAEYEVRVGDLVGSAKGGDDDGQLGPRIFGAELRWERGVYLESARGETHITLRSRVGEQGEWKTRAELIISVCPTKISEGQYEAMCDDLVIFGSGIVLDLVSKSRARGLEKVDGYKTALELSGLAELGELEALLARLSRDLRAVLSAPLTALERKVERLKYHGTERLGPGGYRGLAQAVADSRLGTWPLELRREVARESLDTIEHRSIAAFLDLLLEEVRQCRASASDTIEAYEEDLRFLAPLGAEAGARSLQRIEVLQVALSRLERLERELRERRSHTWLKSVRSRQFFGRTPISASVPAYRGIWNEMNRWLAAREYSQTCQIDERVKSTSRLYEQWIFLSLVSAFQLAGLRCREQVGALGRKSRYRFTLELDRGSCVTFDCPNSASRLVVRYEPWITSREQARASGDTVYRGEGRFSLLSPDVLVEHRVAGPTHGSEETVFAFVVDAKYSRRIYERTWEKVARYRGIKSVATRRTLVRHIWLANPHGLGLELMDDSISWTDRGPDTPPDEEVNGRISAIPTHLGPEGSQQERGVCPEILEFARGMLRYMNITSGQEGSMREAS